MKILIAAVLVIGVTACAGTAEPDPISTTEATPTAKVDPTDTPNPTAIPTSTPTVDADVLEQAKSLIKKMVEAGWKVALERNEAGIWVATEEKEEDLIEIFRLIGSFVEIDVGEESISLLIESFSVDNEGLLVVAQPEEKPVYAWDSERVKWLEQLRLGLPERVEDCQAIDSIDEILAVEREGFSFETDEADAPSARFEFLTDNRMSSDRINIWNLRAEKNGFKPVSCTRLEVEGGYIYLVGFAIRNSDGTTSFIHTFIGGKVDGKELPIDYYKGSEVETTAGPLLQELRRAGNNLQSISIAREVNDMANVEKYNNQYLAKLLSDQPELNGLLRKTVTEGRISPKLERLILPLFSVSFPP